MAILLNLVKYVLKCSVIQQTHSHMSGDSHACKTCKATLGSQLGFTTCTFIRRNGHRIGYPGEDDRTSQLYNSVNSLVLLKYWPTILESTLNTLVRPHVSRVCSLSVGSSQF